MVYRVYVEKKAALANEARALLEDLRAFLGIESLTGLRLFNRYDLEGISRELFDYTVKTVLSEPQLDIVTDALPQGDAVFAVEYLPGQYDQRADSAAQCVQILSQGERPLVRTARVYALEGKLTDAEIAAIKQYVINPVESREASLELPETLRMEYDIPTTVRTVEGFTAMDSAALDALRDELGLAMDLDDLTFLQRYFRDDEHREPTITEIRVVDTYWSDHCRHTTFSTHIDAVEILDEKTLAAYILAHGMEIAKYSTRSLAEVTYTSPPTVLRLCKKLGFTGFDDFKQNFVRELEYLDQQQGKVDFNFPFAENDSPMRVAQNIGELYEEAVKDTMQLLRYEDLHKAVLLLKYHEEIHIFSAGTAINQAESFREKMLKIGKRVVIFNNLNYQRYQACCLSERDLAMIISYSGETAQMLEIARQCKRSGTPILALTSFGENSLTCYADCKLTLSTKESIYQNLGDYASHLSMTLLLDILYSEYFRQNYQKNYTYKLERARELEQHRTSTNPILLNLHKENAE